MGNVIDISTAPHQQLDVLASATERPDGERALGAVFDFIGRYVVFPSDHARVAATLWAAHTHCMEAWHTTPRLAAMSEEKESGKTRLLEVLAMLTPGAILSFNISPAALVRKVAAGGVTLHFDEIDAIFGTSKREEANIDLRSILNSGYKRGAVCYRCVTIGNKHEVEELESFAPVAVAGLKDLPDTLASRAIIIRMRRRAPDEKVEPFRLRYVTGPAAAVYAQLSAWCETHCATLADAEPEMPEGVADRAAECWEPLLAVADAAGGEWPALARAAAGHFVQGGRDEIMSPGVELLEHIRDAIGTADAIWTEELLQRLHDRPESPWKDIRGRPLDDRGLARRLRGFSIKSQDVKLGGTNRKGYRREQFAESWRRYLPHLSATSATNATGLTNNNKMVAQVALVADNAVKSPCAQCNLDDGLQRYRRVWNTPVWLHEECLRFYMREHRT